MASWIVSSMNLKKLGLYQFYRCEIMPPLGNLPSLELLQIWLMKSVKRVGDELFGIESRKRNIHILATSSSGEISLRYYVNYTTNK